MRDQKLFAQMMHQTFRRAEGGDGINEARTSAAIFCFFEVHRAARSSVSRSPAVQRGARLWQDPEMALGT